MNDDEVDFNVEIAIWSPFIGKYLLTFGNIERVVHDVISDYLRDSLVPTTALRSDFRRKLLLFQNILLSTNIDDEFGSRLGAFVASVTQLRATRNLLAHNALCLSFEDGKNEELKFIGFEISSHENEQSIALATLRNQLNELEKCNTTLHELVKPFYANELDHIVKPN
jgi:hypothetical protein